MTWDEHYRLCAEATRKPGEEFDRRMQAARKRVAQNTPDDWRWLADALADPERRWFVAGVFKAQSVPRRLFGPMLRAGVLERDPSLNRRFVEPCVRSFGGGRVLAELLRYLEAGTDAEKAGAASALYWAGDNPRDEDLAEVRQRLRCQMLREFVGNPDVDVKRRIIPMLLLEPEAYPEELRPLVAVAIELARSHPDEYIRHRVEVQLGAGGLLMPIPDTGTRQAEPGAAADGGGHAGFLGFAVPLWLRVRRFFPRFPGA